jgi:hypothetical protein
VRETVQYGEMLKPLAATMDHVAGALNPSALAVVAADKVRHISRMPRHVVVGGSMASVSLSVIATCAPVGSVFYCGGHRLCNCVLLPQRRERLKRSVSPIRPGSRGRSRRRPPSSSAAPVAGAVRAVSPIDTARGLDDVATPTMKRVTFKGASSPTSAPVVSVRLR